MQNKVAFRRGGSKVQGMANLLGIHKHRTLHSDEFCDRLSNLTNLTRHELGGIFELMDSDNSGHISLTEFVSTIMSEVPDLDEGVRARLEAMRLKACEGMDDGLPHKVPDGELQILDVEGVNAASENAGLV